MINGNLNMDVHRNSPTKTDCSVVAYTIYISEKENTSFTAAHLKKPYQTHGDGGRVF